MSQADYDPETGEYFDAPPPERCGAGRFGNTAKLAAALAKAQGVIEDAVKDATNPHFKSKFADLASVRAAIRQPLSDNGIAYVQLVRSGGKAVEVETLLLHDSGQVIGDTLTIPLLQNTPQAVGSAISYGRRYSLMSIVGLAADDDDAENAMARNAPTSARKTTRGPDWGKPAAAKRNGDWEAFQADLMDAKSAVSLERLRHEYVQNKYPDWTPTWRAEADEEFEKRLAQFSQGDALQETMDSLVTEPQTRAEYIQTCHDFIEAQTGESVLMKWWQGEASARRRFSLNPGEVLDLKNRVIERRKELTPEAPHGRDMAGRPLDLVADAG